MKTKIKIYITILFSLLCFAEAFAQQNELQIGVMYYNNKELDKAEDVFTRLYQKDKSYTIYSYLYRVLFEKQSYDELSQVIKKQTKQFPDDLRYKIDEGALLIAQEQPEKGYKIYDEVIKKLTPVSNTIYTVANAFNMKQDLEYMKKTFLKGRELTNDPTNFSLDLGYIYQVTGETNNMLEEYITWLRKNPNQKSYIENRLQMWLNDDLSNSKSEQFRNIMLKKVQDYPDEILYNELLLWFSIQQKDFEMALMQAIALDKRYNETGARVFDLADICAVNGYYQSAIDAYNYLIKKDKNPDITLNSKIELTNTQLAKYEDKPKKDDKVLQKIESEYLKILNDYGYTNNTISAVTHLAGLKATHLDKYQEATTILDSTINLANISMNKKAEVKLQLADIYLFTGEQWEALLLYSQVEKSFPNETIGHDAKFRNARLSYYIGEFEWAKTQLDVLRAATSKLIANDAMDLSLLINDNVEEDTNYLPLSVYSHADLLLYQGKTDNAKQILDSLISAFPGHPIIDEALYKIGEIYKNKGEYELALKYYKRVVDEYYFDLLADDALYNTAIIYEEINKDKPKAIEAYQRLIREYPTSLYIVDVRKRLRELLSTNPQNNS